MARKKKGGKKTDEQAGGDTPATSQNVPGPSTQPQAGQGAGDAPQDVQKSQGTQQRAKGKQQQPQQKDQQGQGPRQVRQPEQQGQGPTASTQQQGQGPWQGRRPEQHGQGPAQTRGPQQGQGPWQGRQPEQQGQGQTQARGPQQGQGPWQGRQPEQQGHARGPQQGQGPRQGRQPEQQVQGQTQARGPQQGQGPWQGTQPEQQGQGQMQTRGPQQGQGAWQGRQPEQGQGQTQTRGPQQGQGPWQGRQPEQQGQGQTQARGPQQGQGPWQGRQPEQHVQGQTQARGPQQGQGPWQGRQPEQQVQGQTQARGPQQGQGAWQGRQPEQQLQGQTQARGPQQGQGAWQGRQPEQQFQGQTQARGPQQGQGPWQGRQPGQQGQGPRQGRGPGQQGQAQTQTRGPQQGQGDRQQPYAQQKGRPQSQSGTQSLVKSSTALDPEMQKLSLNRGGTKGRRIQVETNYLSMDFGKLPTAFHYDVQIVPDTPKRWLRHVFEQFRKKHFPDRHPAFDGKRNMYSPIELLQNREEISDEIELRMPDESKTKNYKVVVKFATSVDLSPLRDMRVNSSQQALQCVEIVLRNAPSMKLIQAGRSFFTQPPKIIDLGDGCEMYYGHYQTVVRGWKPFFNIDVAHKAFPKRMNVVDLIAEFSSDWKNTVTRDGLRNSEVSYDVLNKVGKHLKGLRISYEIPGIPSSRREYRVNGTDVSPRKKMFLVENKNMSIEEYFQKKKNYRLNFPLLPTIWVGSVQRQDKILLPAELCTVIEGQAVNRKMTENQTSAMIKYAATSTDVRKQKIMTSLEKTKHNADACIREFGFSINTEFEKIDARVLDPPSLEYSNGAVCRVSKGVWRQDNNKFLKGAELPSWIIVSTCGNLSKDCQNFANLVSNYGTRMGMRLNPKAGNFDCLTGRVTQRDVSNMLQKYCTQYSLIFVIINDSGPSYSYVKKAAEISLNCLTQCIKKRTLNRMNPSTVGNILLKVNSKLNGTNHCLRTRPAILNQPCMIMGADVTHPSPDSKDIPSVVAVTASHDPRALFGYNMCCRLQLPTVEIIEDLEAITKEHLMYFYNQNRGQKPYHIIFLRDGVSEGQFEQVKQVELSAIRRACTAMQQGYEPKITFIVVQKRHHTRFFPKPQDSEDRNNNVPAGTCVDTMITSPNVQDFYLVSHASIQGVAKPTKYSTLWDDNDLSYDDVEELTYYLCHLFSRCNRSVSYPAPTYYAHLGAARAKVYLESETINLNNLKNEHRKLQNDKIRKDKPMFFV